MSTAGSRPDNAAATPATRQAVVAPTPRGGAEVAEVALRAAVEFVVLCGSARLLLAEHQPDEYQRCRTCTDHGVHNVRYPCVVAFVAQQALPLTRWPRLN